MSVRSMKLSDAETKQILGGPIKIVVTPDTMQSKNLVFVVGDFAPGEGLVPHIHPKSEEVYYVVSGEGTVYAGAEKKPMPVSGGMVLYIPEGTPHYVRNTGKEQLQIGFFLSPGTEDPTVLE
ncbi:MAG: cupin domain-containing protein [Candidatus Bathyarchaeia archaeon]